jgi:hypothetical protein
MVVQELLKNELKQDARAAFSGTTLIKSAESVR